MNFIEIKEEAKKLTSKHILKFWKSSLLVFASSITLAIILGIISCGVLAFITELLALPLYIGFISYILGLTRKEEVSLTDIFQDYKKIGLIVVTLIISYVFIIFGYILLIIPGIMIAFSLVMVGYLLADSKETSISEAKNIIRESIEMMNGYKLDYFIFELSFIGWYFLGAITFGIAYIYVIPYFTFANTLYYQRLKEKRKS
ncbi:MAG: DUF975 family protein [Bacilli bacterium]|jgi:uncharacterized membrane protein|nr:DUF975 family protein [Bacilli bacterium]